MPFSVCFDGLKGHRSPFRSLRDIVQRMGGDSEARWRRLLHLMLLLLLLSVLFGLYFWSAAIGATIEYGTGSCGVPLVNYARASKDE